jgi:hypothetical protein
MQQDQDERSLVQYYPECQATQPLDANFLAMGGGQGRNYYLPNNSLYEDSGWQDTVSVSLSITILFCF